MTIIDSMDETAFREALTCVAQLEKVLRACSQARLAGDVSEELHQERRVRSEFAFPGTYVSRVDFPNGDGTASPFGTFSYGVVQHTETKDFCVVVRTPKGVRTIVDLKLFLTPFYRSRGENKNMRFLLQTPHPLENMFREERVPQTGQVASGLWKHFKANPSGDEPRHGEYVVFGPALLPATKTEFVLYASLYGPRKGHLAIRPLHYRHPDGKLGGFLDEASAASDGIRFKLIEPMSPFVAYKKYVTPLKQKAA